MWQLLELPMLLILPHLPFDSKVSEDGKTWTHTDTDMSAVDAKVKAIAESAWSSDVKTAYKTWAETQTI